MGALLCTDGCELMCAARRTLAVDGCWKPGSVVTLVATIMMSRRCSPPAHPTHGRHHTTVIPTCTDRCSTAKETINRIAKLATKNPRNRASLKTDDTRLLTLLSIPEEALKQKAMSSRGRTGYNTDDLTSIVASLKALRMQNHSLYATLQDTLAEEKRELEETSEPGGSNEKARFR